MCFQPSNVLLIDIYPQEKSNPPSIFIFNVGMTRVRHINDGPNEANNAANLLLQSFTNALESIRAKGYIVQGAMYGPEGGNIFIETNDEEWADHVRC